MWRNALEPWHIIILLLVVFVVFGANKMPDVARSLGRSMRIFKSEVDEMRNDNNPAAGNRPANAAPTRPTDASGATAAAPAEPAPRVTDEAPQDRI